MSSIKHRPAGEIAGQVSEHLAWHARRSRISRQPYAPPLPAGTPAVQVPAPPPQPAGMPAVQAPALADWKTGGTPHPLVEQPARLSGAEVEDRLALSSLLPPGAEATLSADEWRAMEMLYEQKMAPPPRGTPFLTFTLNKLRWGVSAPHLREVLPHAPAITPLPFSPRWLHGLINLRGEPVGLVNLAELLLDPITAATVAHRAAASGPVIVAEDDGALLGLLVEELGEVVFIEDQLLGAPPAAEVRALPAFATSHLQGACDLAGSPSPLLLLDLPRLTTTLLQDLAAREAFDG